MPTFTVIHHLDGSLTLKASDQDHKFTSGEVMHEWIADSYPNESVIMYHERELVMPDDEDTKNLNAV